MTEMKQKCNLFTGINRETDPCLNVHVNVMTVIMLGIYETSVTSIGRFSKAGLLE